MILLSQYTKGISKRIRHAYHPPRRKWISPKGSHGRVKIFSEQERKEVERFYVTT